MKVVMRVLVFVGLMAAFFGGLWLFGMLFGVGGDGCTYFAQWIESPSSVWDTRIPYGLGIWALLGLLFALRKHLICRLAAAMILLVHYAGIVALTRTTYEWYYIERTWKFHRELVVVFVGIYVTSQLALWFLILKAPGRKPVSIVVPEPSGPTPPPRPVTDQSENPYRSPES